MSRHSNPAPLARPRVGSAAVGMVGVRCVPIAASSRFAVRTQNNGTEAAGAG